MTQISSGKDFRALLRAAVPDAATRKRLQDAERAWRLAHGWRAAASASRALGREDSAGFDHDVAAIRDLLCACADTKATVRRGDIAGALGLSFARVDRALGHILVTGAARCDNPRETCLRRRRFVGLLSASDSEAKRVRDRLATAGSNADRVIDVLSAHHPLVRAMSPMRLRDLLGLSTAQWSACYDELCRRGAITVLRRGDKVLTVRLATATSASREPANK